MSKPGSCWRLQDMSIQSLACSSLCWSHSPRLEASFWRQFNQLNGHTSAAILPISESCDSLGPTQKMQGHFPISRSLPILPVTCLFQSQVLWIVDTVGDRHSALYSNMFPALYSNKLTASNTRVSGVGSWPCPSAGIVCDKLLDLLLRSLPI